MKNAMNLILMGTFVFGMPLFAQFDSSDFSTLENAGTRAEEEKGPFSAHTTFDYIGHSDIDKEGFSNQHINYSTVEVGVGSIIYYDECNNEGLNLTLDYERTKLSWRQNPYFSHSTYNTVTVGLGGFTDRVCDWNWQAYLGINIDVDHPQFQYTTYDMLLWGRYDYCPDFIGLHFGIIAETGLKADRVLPILGFDWKINNCWKLNAVFPVNMALVYTIDENWSAAIAGRIFSCRQRASKHSVLPEAVWTYRNSGVEAAINYDLGQFHVNAHVGMTLGGKFRVANRHYRNSHRFDLDSAPYVGGEVTYRF